MKEMSDMITIKRKTCISAMLIAFLLLGTSANGQTKKTIDSLTKASTWIDKDTGKKLNALVEYQKIKVMHTESLVQYDKLESEFMKCDSIKNLFLNRQRELRKNLVTIYSSRTKPKAERAYLNCDTTILIRHEGLYGDSATECVQKALLAYHRAELVLSERYDKGSVEKARELLEKAKAFLPEECAELDCRLEQYGALTECFRNALVEADTLDRFEPTEELSSYSIKEYSEGFINKLAEKLNPVLLVPYEYPYLYGILTKAMSVIIDDPRKDITELIEEL